MELCYQMYDNVGELYKTVFRTSVLSVEILDSHCSYTYKTNNGESKSGWIKEGRAELAHTDIFVTTDSGTENKFTIRKG